MLATTPMDTTALREELLALPGVIKGHESLRIALERTRTKEDLMQVMGQYIHFNAPFGAGVAALAGQVASRRELFGDETEPVHILSDRSGEIGAHIFAAAIDELRPSATHRMLAQDAIKAVGKFFGIRGDAFTKTIEPNTTTLREMKNVERGYGIGRKMSEHDLLHGIGFHIGSEELAGNEFRIIVDFLQTRHPNLVEYMKTVDLKIATYQTWIWLEVHCTLEDEHRDAALQAGKLAQRWYRGKRSASAVKKNIVEGFSKFAQVQSEFMNYIAGR